MVLPRRKETFISTPFVRVNRLVTVVRRHITPQNGEHRICPIPENELQDLTNQARNGDPNPKRGSHLDANLINFDGIPLRRSSEASARSRYQSDLFLTDLLFYVSSVFFRICRIVKRETFSALAIPRWEILSWRQATISASFWGVIAQLLGVRVKVLVQA
jgi:hypothetical protein